MSNISYTDAIADESYNEGFKAGQKKAEAKYNKLFNASLAWLQIYESSFGAPNEDDKENSVYFELRKLLKMPK